MSKPKLITRARTKGRPLEILPAGRLLIEAMAAEGNDERTIAKALGIGKTTLRDIRDRDESVADAWDMGHAQLADEITHALLALGRKGNVVALIFLAKCRLGWIDQPQPKEERAPSVIINLPEARTPEAHMKLLEHQPQEAIEIEQPEKSDAFGPLNRKVIA